MVDFMSAIKTPFDNIKILTMPFIVYLVIFVLSAIAGGIIDVSNWISLFLGDVGVIATLISLAISAFIGLIVFILTLIVSGYLVSIFEKIMNKKTMPTFQLSEALEYMIKAIKAGVISFVYMLPGTVCMFIAMLILFGGAVFGLISGGNTDAIMKAALTNIFAAGIISIPFIMLGVLFLLVAAYLLPAALAVWFKSGKMIGAFSFGRIIKNVIKVDYLLSLLVAFGVNFLIGMVIGIVMFFIILIVSIILPNVGNAISAFVSNLVSFVVGIMLYSMLAQVIE